MSYTARSIFVACCYRLSFEFLIRPNLDGIVTIHVCAIFDSTKKLMMFVILVVVSKCMYVANVVLF